MGIMRRGRLGWGWVEAGRGWLGGAGATERGFLLHWGGAKTKGLFFVLARRCRPLADMSPARVGIHAPSSKNSRLIFAQQPRPNDKRNPLHHVLRTAGTLLLDIFSPLGARWGDADAAVRGGKGSEFGVQGKRSEVRGRRSGGTEQPEQPNSHLTQRARTKRKRRKRGKRGKSRTANSHTDGHGRLERAEFRGRGRRRGGWRRGWGRRRGA